MGQALPAAKDLQPGAGPSGLSGPHHHLASIVAEVPPLTRRQVEAWSKPNQPAEPVSLLFGLAIGIIIGFFIRDSFDRR